MRQSRLISREAAIVVAFALLFACLIALLAVGDARAAFAIPLLLAGGVLMILRPVLGLLLLAATIPLEGALMLGGASAARLVGMAVSGAWVLQKLIRGERFSSLMSPGLVHAAALLLALACLSIFWAEYPERMARDLFLLFQLILLAMLVFDLTRSWDRVASVAKFLVVGATIAAALTLEQYFVVGMQRAGEGVVGGINRTATTLVTIVPFAFYLVRSDENAFWRLLGLAYISLTAVAVAATLSRMNYLVFPFVIILHLALMARSRSGRRKAALLGTAALITVSMLPMEVVRQRAESIVPYLSTTVEREDPRESYSARGFNIRVSLAMFTDHPIVGVGYRNFLPHFLSYQGQVPGAWRIYQSAMNYHGSHYGFLAELGVIGFLLWLSIFAAAFVYLRGAWRAIRDPTSPQALLVQTVAIAVGLQFIYAFYENVHTYKLLWMVLGLAVAVRGLATMQKAQSRGIARRAPRAHSRRHERASPVRVPGPR